MHSLNKYPLPQEVLVYLRKSRSDDPTLTVEEVLARHEQMLDEWAVKNLGAKVPEENKFREVVSGETIDARPEIQRILKKIESPKYKAVLLVEIQRLSRGDLEDAGRLIKLFRYTNTLVLTLQRPYDISDEFDRDMFERELKRGNEFLEYTKRILNNGRLLSVSQGNYIGSIPPYGYDKAFVMDGKRRCPTLVPNPEQATVVQMIFDMYVNQDMGRPSICHHLDKLGIKPPKGEHWSQEGLKDMLENVHYIGQVKWNWRKTIRVVEDSEIVKTRPKSQVGEYLIYEGKHEAIISEELFYAARAKQGRNHRAKASTKIRNPLAGLVYCRCGRAMSLRTYKHHPAEPRLSCDNQVHCRTGSCLYQDMVDRVIDILKECIEDFEVRIESQTSDSVALQARLIADLERKMEQLLAREVSQWETQSDPDPSKRMPAEIFQMLNEKLVKEKAQIQQALCDAYDAMPEPVDYQEQIMRFQDALTALQDPEVDAGVKNRLLKACIDRIIYHRDKPERIKRDPTKKKGTQFESAGGRWTTPPIELDVRLKV